MAALWMVAIRSAAAQTDDGAAAEGAGSEAKRFYSGGKLAYAAGKYEEAIALFERAYALSEAPGLLFNLAQAHRLAGESHCAEAYALYKSYLGALPNAENRKEVEERLVELKECAEESERAAVQDAATVPVEPEPPPPEPSIRLSASDVQIKEPEHGRTPMWIAIAGAATALAGAALYTSAFLEYRDAEKRCPCYPGTFTKWERLTYVSYGALGLGSAAALVGASWWASGFFATDGASAQIGMRGRF